MDSLKIKTLDKKSKITFQNFDTNKAPKRLNELFPNV